MRAFVGCYTKKITEELVGKGEGIYCFDFDQSSGELKLIDVEETLNPSYITISEDKNFLYAVEEIPIEESPKIIAYKINPEGSEKSLTFINKQDLPGSYSCHLALTQSQKYLVVAAYMSGNALIYPIDENGALLPLSQNISHEGTGPNKVRQEAPHVHMIQPAGENDFYAVDLGIDTAKYYSLNPESDEFESLSSLNMQIENGAGARHMVLHPNNKYAFIFSELTAEVFSFRNVENKWELNESIKSLPADAITVPAGAAIRIHPNGKFIYVSNRGHNSITAFQFNEISEKLELIETFDCGGKTPRDFNIDPSGSWIIAANQDSDNLVVYKIDTNIGSVKRVAENTEVKTACCIQFI